jgi:phage virion morphogenesis protein
VDSGLEALEPWLEAVMNRLKPGERVQLSRKIGQMLRARNAKRIAGNVQPDGSPMEPRKPRRDRRGKLRKSRQGKMFRQTGKVRNLKVRAFPDRVEIAFAPAVSGTAAVHHFGLMDKVEKTPTAPKVRYPARHLLGIPAEDREAVMDAALKWLGER